MFGKVLPIILATIILNYVAIAQISTSEIAARASRATVQIRTLDVNRRPTAQGSGFIIDNKGSIVTNYHVVRGAHSIQIELSNGELFDNVFYVTSDPRRDLVILRIFAEGLSSIILGNDEQSGIGDKVYVMGNPMGQKNTFSDGIVSAKRTVEGVSVIQITAPISAGSSGGPVMNSNGQAIGVATMGIQEGQNLNYAVPIRYVRPLLSTGETARRYVTGILPESTGGLIRPQRGTGIGTGTGGGQGTGSGSGTTGSPGIAGVGNQWETQVRRQIDNIHPVLIGERYSRSHNLVTGSLKKAGHREVFADLRVGVTYAFVAVCDSDCSDIDLRLYSPTGVLLESDLLRNDTPILIHRVLRPGKYKILVSMVGCNNDPCFYGLAIYSR